MPKKFQIEAHIHGKESGDTLLIVQVETVDIICNSWCVLLTCCWKTETVVLEILLSRIR